MIISKIKKGLSIVEVLISLGIILIVISAAALTQMTSFDISKRAKDKAFASQKTVQIMEELRSVVQGGSEDAYSNLDSNNDKDYYNPILTTENLPDPDDPLNDSRPFDPLSGNYKYQGYWKFVRNVEIKRVPTDIRAREVTVQIFYANKDGTPKKPALAKLGSTLRTASSPNIPTQVIDTFALTLDNVPGWWAAVSNLKPMYGNVVWDLGARNPGLEFKNNFINRLSYGRDKLYAPYSNHEVVSKDDDNADFVYFYPGKVHNTKGGAEEEYYQTSNMLKDNARLLLHDGSNHFVDNSLNDNLEKYTLADQFNHAVRFPEEWAIHERLVKARNDYNSIVSPDQRNSELQPTYRLLLEEMASSDKYKNAIFANLHGELIPFPPIRNYSDAAKDPINKPSVRVVSHPERVKYEIDPSTGNPKSASSKNVKVRLRVYSYLRNYLNLSPTDSANNIDRISIFIPTTNKLGENGQVVNDHTVFKIPQVDFDDSEYAKKELLKKIKVLHIDKNFEKVSSEDGARAIGTLNILNTSNSDDLIIGAGSIFTVNSIPVITLSETTITSNGSATVDIVSGLIGYYDISDSVTSFTVDTPGKITTDISQVGISSIALSGGSNTDSKGYKYMGYDDTQPNTHESSLEKYFDLVVNPVFDADGDGTNEKVSGLLLILKDTPVNHTQQSNNGKGLPYNKKLYGMEYIPTPLFNYNGNTNEEYELGFPDNRDLSATGNKVKNTARWIIEFDLSDGIATNKDLSAFRGRTMIFETRLGNDLNTGAKIDGTVPIINGELVDGTVDGSSPNFVNSSSSTHTEANYHLKQMPNVSRTYSWVEEPGGLDSVKFPSTEKNQILGDPRHNPYYDVLMNRGYNWFFGPNNNSGDNNEASTVGKDNNNYTSVKGLSGWAFDNVGNDVPRMFEFFRNALLGANAIYTSMTGYSYYYYGIGGEIGLDSNNPQSFNISYKPYNGTGTRSINDGSINEIINNVKLIMKDNNSWVSLPWLGELYPDEEFASSWMLNGNLPVSDFKRGNYNTSVKSIHSQNPGSSNTKVDYNSRLKRLGPPGCASFFNGSYTPTDTNRNFNHQGSGSNSSLTDVAGQDLSSSFNLPLISSIKTTRPFGINMWGNKPPELNSTYKQDYINMRTKLSYLPFNTSGNNTINDESVFYKHSSSLVGSSIVRMERNSNIGDAKNRAHVIVNGLAPEGDSARSFLAKYAISTMLYTFFDTGNYTSTDTTGNSTAQVPLLEIASSDNQKTPEGSTPKEGSEINSTSLDLEWNIGWLRWDGVKYNNNYNTGWTEGSNVNLMFNIMYSSDSGDNWKYVQDNSVALPGNYSPTHGISGNLSAMSGSDSGFFRGTYSWDISGLEDEKSYLYRIEAYRFINGNLIKLHYSHHQREFYVKRG